MKTKQKHAVLLTGIAAVLILILCLGLLQELLRPKYGQLNIPEGTLIADYYDDPTHHDVVFIGDCEVYENFSPVTLWEEQGITSFIRGSAQQLIWQSYYLLEETLQYETPEVVVFNVLSMKYGEPQSEAYNRLNLDGMRWSASKLGAIRASMTEEEDFLSYVFPLLRYHSRWSELSGRDVTGMSRLPACIPTGTMNGTSRWRTMLGRRACPTSTSWTRSMRQVWISPRTPTTAACI